MQTQIKEEPQRVAELRSDIACVLVLVTILMV